MHSSIKLDEFISNWSGNFESFLVSPPPDVIDVPPNPAGAHADSDTDASCSPVTQIGDDAAVTPKIGSMPPQSPVGSPPWKRARASYAAGPSVQAKARPAAPPSEPSPSQELNAGSSTASIVNQALLDYRAAEKAVSNCAKESLYGAYNDIYYRVEKKVAIEKEVSWRDRGPREQNPEDQPKIWKSQKWRENKGRYANRGGKSREHFAQKYGARKPEANPSSSSTAVNRG